jgi:hypothetical protein
MSPADYARQSKALAKKASPQQAFFDYIRTDPASCPSCFRLHPALHFFSSYRPRSSWKRRSRLARESPLPSASSSSELFSAGSSSLSSLALPIPPHPPHTSATPPPDTTPPSSPTFSHTSQTPSLLPNLTTSPTSTPSSLTTTEPIPSLPQPSTESPKLVPLIFRPYDASRSERTTFISRPAYTRSRSERTRSSALTSTCLG